MSPDPYLAVPVVGLYVGTPPTADKLDAAQQELGRSFNTVVDYRKFSELAMDEQDAAVLDELSRRRLVLFQKIETWSPEGTPYTMADIGDGRHDLILYNSAVAWQKYLENHPDTYRILTVDQEMNSPYYPAWDYSQTTPEDYARGYLRIRSFQAKNTVFALNFHAQKGKLFQYLQHFPVETYQLIALDNFVHYYQDIEDFQPEKYFAGDVNILRNAGNIRQSMIDKPDNNVCEQYDPQFSLEDCRAAASLSAEQAAHLQAIPIFVGEFSINAGQKYDANHPAEIPGYSKAWTGYNQYIFNGKASGLSGGVFFNLDKAEHGEFKYWKIRYPQVQGAFRRSVPSTQAPLNIGSLVQPDAKLPEIKQNARADLEYLLKNKVTIDHNMIEKSTVLQDELIYAAREYLADKLYDRAAAEAQKERFFTQAKDVSVGELRARLDQLGYAEPKKFSLIIEAVNVILYGSFDYFSRYSVWKQSNQYYHWFSLDRFKQIFTGFPKTIKPEQVARLLRFAQPVTYTGDGQVKVGSEPARGQITVKSFTVTISRQDLEQAFNTQSNRVVIALRSSGYLNDNWEILPLFQGDREAFVSTFSKGNLQELSGAIFDFLSRHYQLRQKAPAVLQALRDSGYIDRNGNVLPKFAERPGLDNVTQLNDWERGIVSTLMDEKNAAGKDQLSYLIRFADRGKTTGAERARAFARRLRSGVIEGGLNTLQFGDRALHWYHRIWTDLWELTPGKTALSLHHGSWSRFFAGDEVIETISPADLRLMAADWTTLQMNLTGKFFAEYLAPSPLESGNEELANLYSTSQAFLIYRDGWLTRNYDRGNARFALGKYRLAVDEYLNVIDFQGDAQRRHPLHFYEAVFGVANSHKISALVENDVVFLDEAEKIIREKVLNDPLNNNFGYLARAHRELADFCFTRLQAFMSESTVAEIEAVKRKAREHLLIALQLNRNETQDYRAETQGPEMRERLKQEKFFKVANFQPGQHIKIVPQEANIIHVFSNGTIVDYNLVTTVRDGTVRVDVYLINGQPLSAGAILPEEVRTKMAEADRDAKELKQSWNIIDERGDKVRSGQDTLVDLAANGLHLTAKNPNGPKLPAGSYSLQIGGANSLPFTVNAKIEDQNRQAQALPFDRELSFVSPRSELIGSRVPFKNIWEAQWNYHTLDGQAFEVAKIFIGMGKFFGFNLISEERAYSRQEKEARYREAVKWFSVAADNPFFQEAFDSHEEGNWLANPHRPDEFFLYRALGYKGRADANFGLFSLNGDKNCLYPAINDYREAIRLMDEYRRKAPGGFSLYTWEEKHTFYLTRIRLAAAYLEKFRQNQADRETLKVALNEIQRVNDEENMIKDQNIRLELYLTAVSIYAEIKERGLELGRYLNIPSPAALSDKLSFYQRKAEDILNGGGGYAHLQSLYSTLIDTGNGNLNYFYPVVEIEERCQGSGYAALQNCISLAKKETDPVKAVIRLRQILPKIGNSADKVKAELLSQLADTLMGLTQVQLESRSLRDSLTADYRDELKLAAHADPNFLAILTPLLSKDIAAFNHNELRLLIYCIAFNKVSEAIGLVPTIPPSKFKNMDTGKKGLMGILLNKRLDIVNNIR